MGVDMSFLVAAMAVALDLDLDRNEINLAMPNAALGAHILRERAHIADLAT